MSFNDEFPVSQVLSRFKPRRQMPKLFGQPEGQDGTSRKPRGRGFDVPVPSTTRGFGKNGASMYKPTKDVRKLVLASG